MRYENVIPAIFRSRPNRFIAYVEIDGQEAVVHVKNTGRCRELLVPGSRVYLAHSDNPTRKTGYDLIAVEKKRADGSTLLINMDSQVVNAVAEEWLRGGTLFSPSALIRREVTWGNSRFDFYVEDGARRAFLEVKGVTLEADGVTSFPDAPTERGVKHLRELISCVDHGLEAYLLFVVQMKDVRCFHPNDRMHEAFGSVLREAAAKGVRVLAYNCSVFPDEISMDREITVDLS